MIAETVAAPLEQALNGVENMLYMRSGSSSTGSLTIAITFAVGTNPDISRRSTCRTACRARCSSCPRRCAGKASRSRKRCRASCRSSRSTSPDGRYDDAVRLELRDAQRDRRAAAHPGRRQRADVRRARLFDPDLAAGPIGSRSSASPRRTSQPPCASRTRKSAAGRLGDEPTNERVDLTLSVTTQGRLTDPERVRADRRCSTGANGADRAS